MSTEEFNQCIGEKFATKMISTALELVNIKCITVIAHTQDDIAASAIKAMSEKEFDLDNSLVIYSRLKNDMLPNPLENKWICGCFEVASPQDLVKIVNKIDKMKAFL